MQKYIESDSYAVIVGQARFSQLTDGLMRLEYAPTGQFEERRSVRAITRPAAIPFLDAKERDGVTILSGERMTIHYREDGHPFSADNLQVYDVITGKRIWMPGQQDDDNLGGAHLAMDVMHRAYIPHGVHPATTEYHDNGHSADLWRYAFEQNDVLEFARYQHMPLDQICATCPQEKWPEYLKGLMQERAKYPPGFLSKSGYFLYNDSATPLWDDDADWLTARPETGNLDYYLFYYQQEYTQALADAVVLFGKPPLPPRYSFGCWYSRFPTFNEAELRELVKVFTEQHLPLDVLVLDLEWHRNGWAGYDWDTEQFSHPQEFLDDLHAQDIHTTLNIHPYGFSIKESRAQEFFAAAGIDAQTITVNENGIFDKYDLARKDHADAFLNVLHLPVQQQGVDFWWIDGTAPVVEQPIDGMFWTDFVYQRHAEQTAAQRPLIFSRSGGIGSHRFPFHFTGDTFSQWEVLASQVEYTLRAGHMALSFVTHDIGGHMSSYPFLDPEMYCRWVQWGALSPIFRLHSSQGGERRPWLYGERATVCFREAMTLRMQLLPYLYTLAYRTHEQGLPMCRSFALAYPQWEAGYAVWDSYMLGDRLCVTPILHPGDYRQVLLPPGAWYHGVTGQRIDSDGQTPQIIIATTEQAPLHFYRAGSVMVKQTFCERAAKIPDEYDLEIYLGGAGSQDEFECYEDDGISRRYNEQQYSLTRFTLQEETERIAVTIYPATGAFAAQPARRTYHIRLIGGTIRDVFCNGQPVAIRLGAEDSETIVATLSDCVIGEQLTLSIILSKVADNEVDT